MDPVSVDDLLTVGTALFGMLTLFAIGSATTVKTDSARGMWLMTALLAGLMLLSVILVGIQIKLGGLHL